MREVALCGVAIAASAFVIVAFATLGSLGASRAKQFRRLAWEATEIEPANTAGLGHFSRPNIVDNSASCVALEFTYDGTERLSTIVAFTRRPEDLDFIQWGGPILSHLVRKGDKPKGSAAGLEGRGSATYRALVQHLPHGGSLQAKLSVTNDLTDAFPVSPPSKKGKTHPRSAATDPPSNLQVHRTDPRLNKPKHDGSVCMDLHWEHAHTALSGRPGDVYFRVAYNYTGEGEKEFCSDFIDEKVRNCGKPLTVLAAKLPTNYATICGLRPKHHIVITVSAFNCDNIHQSSSLAVHTPPNAPSVVASMVTTPMAQESVAGFRPRAVLDWIPQHDPRIAGHAVYLGLNHISTMKLLCWIPSYGSKFSNGHLELPIAYTQHTHTEDTRMYDDYLKRFPVHQEEELYITTRTTENLESPAFTFLLGSWLVEDYALKCLTSFDAPRPAYAAEDQPLAWTQAESLSLYD